MGKMRILQENNQNYVVCSLENGEELDEDCLATISEEQVEEGQRIEGIIPAIYSQALEERMIRYDVSNYTPLMKYLSCSNTKEAIISVFLAIANIYQSVNAFLLDASCFVLEKEFIFADAASGEIHMLMYPVYGGWRQKDLKRLFGEIMQAVSLGREDMSFYGMVMYALNQTESFSIVKFREQLLELSKEKGETAGTAPAAAAPGSDAPAPRPAEVPKVPQEHPPLFGNPPVLPAKNPVPKKQEEQKGLFRFLGGKKETCDKDKGKDRGKEKEREKGQEKASKKKSQVNSFIEAPDDEVLSDKTPAKATVKPAPFQREEIPMTSDELEDYGGTVDNDGEPSLVLFYVAENRYITVNSFPFEMGREGRDLKVAPEKNKVSRKHAEIIRTPEGFRVCDYSKLGTFLDGVRIPSGQSAALRNGMRMMLKDEEFIVSIYEN